MFGWFKKILKKLVAEEVNLMRTELKQELEAKVRSVTKDELKTDLKMDLRMDLKAELKDELKEELQDEMIKRFDEFFDGFKNEMTEGFKEDLTGDFKKEMAEELKEEFKELKEQVLEISRNKSAERVYQQAEPPGFERLAANPGKDNEVILNIGPGFKELFNDKNSSVNKKILKQFVSEALAELKPAQSHSLTKHIVNNDKIT